MKRLLFIGFIMVLAVATVTALFVGRLRPSPRPMPSPTPTTTFNAWRGVSPGVTSVNELTSLFGPPTSTTQGGDQKTIFYPSTNQYWKNEIEATKEVVTFMKERLFDPLERSLAVVSSEIPGQPIVLYGPDFESGYLLYAYPESGIAFYAQEDRKIVYEIWRFAPTSLRGFLSLPAASRYGLSPRHEPE